MPRERREHKRCEYQCPVWFGDDAYSLRSGALVDLSREGLALVSTMEDSGLQIGQSQLIQFSPPRQDACMGKTVTRTGQICRIEVDAAGTYHVAMRLDHPLWLDPSKMATNAWVAYAEEATAPPASTH